MTEANDEKRTDKKRDGGFLLRTIIYALLILGIINAFTPYMGKATRTPDKSEVTQLAADIGFTTSADVGAWLKASKKPAVLMVYASWCNYCKLTMPHMLNLWREKAFEGKQLLFVSVDTSPTALANYVLGHELESMIGKPVIVRASEAPSLPEVLAPLGSAYGGGVPYIGFYAPGGKLVTELHGLSYKSSIKKALHALDR